MKELVQPVTFGKEDAEKIFLSMSKKMSVRDNIAIGTHHIDRSLIKEMYNGIMNYIAYIRNRECVKRYDLESSIDTTPKEIAVPFANEDDKCGFIWSGTKDVPRGLYISEENGLGPIVQNLKFYKSNIKDNEELLHFMLGSICSEGVELTYEWIPLRILSYFFESIEEFLRENDSKITVTKAIINTEAGNTIEITMLPFGAKNIRII